MSEPLSGNVTMPRSATAAVVRIHADKIRDPAAGDIIRAGDGVLSPLERGQIAMIQRSLEPGKVDSILRWCQRQIGARWINASIRNLRHVNGLERLPPLDPSKSFLLVSNHRSFFDLYVVSAFLYGRGLPHRLLFPVRSNFFYDNPLGPLVNGAMSFFAMYPPVFRQPKKAAFNLAGLDEVIRLLRRGGMFVGVHPEGTRKRDDDPYTLLPGQPGVGRLIYHAACPVIPVFINGLGNSIPKTIRDNATRKGPPVIVNFGAPIDFGDRMDAAPSPRAYKRLSEHTIDVITSLGAEEREIRKTLGN
jgi:1-acyl-sn-glycerol-3-phosphate acyltransferase